MTPLQHIVEPERLLLTWQPVDEQAAVRTRRVVGEILRESNGQFVFRYLKDTADFQSAQEAGFQGFPAFALNQEEARQGVIETLMRRLPPRNREDFAEYLAQHRLPHPFQNSDFALLGYTGARLPSDGFALVPVFPGNAVPCDYLMEVAGLRHVIGTDVSAIHDGDPVSFEEDPINQIDQDALVVVHQGRRIGYVNRALRESFHHWLAAHRVTGVIERQNGKPERPLVFVRISVS
jgi:hypothetical protein